MAVKPDKVNEVYTDSKGRGARSVKAYFCICKGGD